MINTNSFFYKLKRKFLYAISDLISDKLFLEYIFPLRTGYNLDLKNPRTFNEKIQWLKLYDRNPIYTRMVDKVEAKKYVATIIGYDYIIPTYTIYDCVEDINFDELPKQFVLKCTHDSGGLVICKDKANLDKKAAVKKLKRALNRNYYMRSREWPYKNVMPRVLCEKYLSVNSNGLIDYKFYCFNGEPKVLYISKGLDDHKTASISFLTLDWEFAPFKRSDYTPFFNLPEKPSKYDDMIAIAKKLSNNIPFVRVDLYQVGDQVYFSELTFSPCSGYMPFEPLEWDVKLGEWLQLPEHVVSS